MILFIFLKVLHTFVSYLRISHVPHHTSKICLQRKQQHSRRPQTFRPAPFPQDYRPKSSFASSFCCLLLRDALGLGGLGPIWRHLELLHLFILQYTTRPNSLTCGDALPNRTISVRSPYGHRTAILWTPCGF